MSLKPWREIAVPHPDVLEGTFQQSEFAADITAAAGLGFAHRIPDGELSNIVESVGSGAAGGGDSTVLVTPVPCAAARAPRPAGRDGRRAGRGHRPGTDAERFQPAGNLGDRDAAGREPARG